MGRLGQGFDPETCTTPTVMVPKKVETQDIFEETMLMNVSCGRTMNYVAVKSGSLYTWGKGEHEKPHFDDYMECSIPKSLIEDKQIVYVSCGATHVMTLDLNGRIYGWGDGT